MKKGSLTLNQLEKAYKQAKVFEVDNTIKSWQEPFLWALWCIKGWTDTGESLKMYWVEFRGTRYLLKAEDI